MCCQIRSLFDQLVEMYYRVCVDCNMIIDIGRLYVYKEKKDLHTL